MCGWIGVGVWGWEWGLKRHADGEVVDGLFVWFIGVGVGKGGGGGGWGAEHIW